MPTDDAGVSCWRTGKNWPLARLIWWQLTVCYRPQCLSVFSDEAPKSYPLGGLLLQNKKGRNISDYTKGSELYFHWLGNLFGKICWIRFWAPTCEPHVLAKLQPVLNCVVFTNLYFPAIWKIENRRKVYNLGMIIPVSKPIPQVRLVRESHSMSFKEHAHWCYIIKKIEM